MRARAVESETERQDDIDRFVVALYTDTMQRFEGVRYLAADYLMDVWRSPVGLSDVEETVRNRVVDQIRAGMGTLERECFDYGETYDAYHQAALLAVVHARHARHIHPSEVAA